MVSIKVKNLTVSFTIYNDNLPSFKDYILDFFVQKKLSKKTTFNALDNISFNLKKGERLGIIGHNGAGKSTLLKTICKIYEPEKGTINTKGMIAPLLEIGAGFHPEYTGRENIHLNGTLLGHNKDTLNIFEQNIIDFAGIDDFIDTPVKYYSTGMFLRLGFSIATTITPDILILDEMFAGGDNEFVKKASKKMNELIDGTSILILVSHDLDLIQRFCDRVIWLEKGRIRADGPTKKILTIYN
tara:strand:+ start:653 stop:1378 length:726 start_codon:yes stop_codon:yes gene_type:complete